MRTRSLGCMCCASAPGSIRALAVLALLVGAGTPRIARSEVVEGRHSRVEVFASAGLTHAFNSWAETSLWPRLQLGVGYRVNSTLSAGADASWEYMGTYSVIYFPPGGDFLGATATVAMVPVRGYLTMRLPRIQRTRPYVSVCAGSYTLLTHIDGVGPPSFSRTRPGVGAAFGISGDETHFAPRLEFAYEARSTSDEELGGPMPKGWLHQVTMALGMRFQP